MADSTQSSQSKPYLGPFNVGAQKLITLVNLKLIDRLQDNSIIRESEWQSGKELDFCFSNPGLTPARVSTTKK